VLPRLTEHDVVRLNVAEGRFVAGRAAESCNRGCEPLGLEAVPRVFVLPDVDDAEALIGRPATCRIKPSGTGSTVAAAISSYCCQLAATSWTKA
jgi:hypothetical protein